MTDQPQSSDHDLLISMNTKLDIALGQVTDHETRIRSLERTKWVLIGASTLAGTAGGASIQQLLH